MAPLQDLEKYQLAKEREELQHPYLARRYHSPSRARRISFKKGTILIPSRAVKSILRRFSSRRFWLIWLSYQLCMFTILAVLYAAGGMSAMAGSEYAMEAPAPNYPYPFHHRHWGGYHDRPLTETCYRQERTATLLALFLGSFGADQWYAHHWPLAMFKLLTLGCSGLWSLVDVVLWIVGGVYGTPGCPGGMGVVEAESWRY